MDEDRRVSRLPAFIFSALAAALAVAAFFVLRQGVHDGHRARLGERDLRLLHVFRSRVASRIRAARMRIEGAELLTAATSPNARTAEALAFAMRRGAGEEAAAAALLLDARAGIRASRRRGSVPPPGGAEKRIWARAVAALRSQKRRKRASGGRFHIEAGSLKGVPVLFVTASSPSTKGYWGLILPAESLLPVETGELGSRESVFLLAEPEQSVLYARQGAKFLYKTVGRSFEKGLAAPLEILVCCDPAAFNTLHEGRRWMVQSRLRGGTRELRLVRVADRRTAGASLVRFDRFLGAGLFVGWAVLVGAFAFLGGRGPRRGVREELPEEAAPPSVGTAALAALSRVSGSVARGDHFREVISLATREAARLIGTDRFYAALYDEAVDRLFEVCSSRLGEGCRAAIATGAEELPERIAVREKDVVEVTSLQEWEEAPEVLRNEGVGAAAVFPLRAGERLVGLMSFYFDAPRELQGEEVDLCSLLAIQGAAAVARALSLAEPPPAD